MRIDIHTHIWPDKIAEKARLFLEQSFRTETAALPTLENLLRFMDKNSVDLSVVNSVASRPDQVPSINQWLFGIRDPRIRVFAAMHPLYRDWQEELKRIRDSASGIKLQPEFQEFYVDDEAAYPLYEKIQEYGLPVLFHCGEELSGTMTVRSSPERMLRVRERFPAMKIIAAHFGGFRLWDGVERHLTGKDIYFDTAFTFGHLDKDKLLELLRRHPQDRVLFGTDFPLIDQKKDIEYLESLELDESRKRKIFSENAMHLLQLQP